MLGRVASYKYYYFVVMMMCGDTSAYLVVCITSVLSTPEAAKLTYYLSCTGERYRNHYGQRGVVFGD